MQLQYQNHTIRNAVASDAAQLADWWNDGTVMAHAGFPNGLGTTPEQVAAQIAADSDDTRRRLILEIDGVRVGEASFYRLADSAAEIGIKICESSRQNHGSGRIFLSMLIGELFSMGCRVIQLDTNLNNHRAQHVYETLGFRKLRVNVDAWTDQVGVKQSSVDYELTKQDFHSFI